MRYIIKIINGDPNATLHFVGAEGSIQQTLLPAQAIPPSNGTILLALQLKTTPGTTISPAPAGIGYLYFTRVNALGVVIPYRVTLDRSLHQATMERGALVGAGDVVGANYHQGNIPAPTFGVTKWRLWTRKIHHAPITLRVRI